MYIIISAGFVKSIGSSLGLGTSVGFWAIANDEERSHSNKRLGFLFLIFNFSFKVYKKYLTFKF